MDKIVWKRGLLFVVPPLILVCLLCILQWETGVLALIERAILLVGGYFIALYDAKHKMIENRFNLLLLAGWCAIMLVRLVLDIQAAFPMLCRSVIGLLFGGGLFLLLYIISRQGLGGGDVKFMAVAGLYLGYQSVVPAMLFGSIYAALYAGILLLLKKISYKDTIPLAPFLYAGMLTTVLFS